MTGVSLDPLAIAAARAAWARVTPTAKAAALADIIDAYGPTCWLRLPGCTTWATTLDHAIAVAAGGAVTDLDNLRGACAHCNYTRGARTVLVPAGHGRPAVLGPSPRTQRAVRPRLLRHRRSRDPYATEIAELDELEADAEGERGRRRGTHDARIPLRSNEKAKPVVPQRDSRRENRCATTELGVTFLRRHRVAGFALGLSLPSGDSATPERENRCATTGFASRTSRHALDTGFCCVTTGLVESKPLRHNGFRACRVIPS